MSQFNTSSWMPRFQLPSGKTPMRTFNAPASGTPGWDQGFYQHLVGGMNWDPMDAARQAATSSGWRVDGNTARMTEPGGAFGFPVERPLSTFGQPNPLGPLSNIPKPILEAFTQETAERQKVADETRNAAFQHADAAQNTLQQAANALLGLSQQFGGQGQSLFDTGRRDLLDQGTERGRVEDALGTSERMSRDLTSGVNKIVGDTTSRVRGDLGVARAEMDRAVTEYDTWAKKAPDLQVEEMSVAAHSMRMNADRQLRSTLQSMQARADAEGRPLSPQELDQAREVTVRDTGAQVQGAITEIGSRWWDKMDNLNKTLAGLRMSKASTYLQGGQMEQGLGEFGLQGEQLKAGGTQFLAGMQMQAAQAELATKQALTQGLQVLSQVNEVNSGIYSAALQTAALWSVQGHQDMADFILKNPKSIVSWYQGLLALLSTGKALEPTAGGGGGGGGRQRAGRQEGDDGMGQGMLQERGGFEGSPFRQPRENEGGGAPRSTEGGSSGEPRLLSTRLADARNNWDLPTSRRP